MGVFSRPVGAGRRYASQTVVRRSSFKTRSSGERNQGGSCETVSCGCVLRCVEASSPHPTVTKGPPGGCYVTLLHPEPGIRLAASLTA